VFAVDLADATSGCEASDFAGFAPGSIALLARGTCTFQQKAANALAAGAVAVVIYNNVPGLNCGNLIGPTSIPVLGTTQAVGLELRNGVLAGPTGVVARVQVDACVMSTSLTIPHVPTDQA
jgi:hypothetical protein